MKIALSRPADGPTRLTASSLQAQLNSIGLKCPDTDVPILANDIAQVQVQIPDPANGVEAWGIYQRSSSNRTPLALAKSLGQFKTATGLVGTAVGNWVPDASGGGYATQLEFMQFPTHFEWLKNNRSTTFIGQGPRTVSQIGANATVDAIKATFVQIGISVSSVLVTGLNQRAFEAALSNAIAPMNDANAPNYDNADSTVLFLVDGYDGQGAANGIGCVTVDWHLQITDYLQKPKNAPGAGTHDWALTLSAWSFLYTDPDHFNADYVAVQSAFKTSAFFSFPPKPQLTVFPSLPPGNTDTFQKSLPVKATKGEATVLVLYAPDLQEIGSVDNRKGKGTATYSKSVTRGFTFTASQTVTTDASFEVNILVVKATFSVGFSLTFTEEWSTETTETISLEVPAGEVSFLYQGVLMASVLVFDANSNSYTYLEQARCLTPILVTSETPLIGHTTIQPPSFVEVAPGPAPMRYFYS
jgi:hypothetical protein